jgi:linoleoyl-CoA desaturase
MSKVKVKFSKQNADFIIELRGRVKEYFEKSGKSRYGNANLVIKSAFMTLLYFTPYVLMLTGNITAGWAVLLSWLIMGAGMSGVGMVLMHDANHGTYSKSSKINKILGKSIYLLGGFPPNWRQQHNTMHHGYTNVDGYDEDIEPINILRFSPHKPLKKIHKYQHWYALFLYGLMTVSWATDKDFNQLKSYLKQGISLTSKLNYRQLFVDLIITKFLYYSIFLIIPLILIPVAWYWVLLGFFAMHFVCGFILGIVFQTAHVMPTSEYPVPDEKGQIENNWAIHQLQTTADYAPGSKVLSWMIGGLNYQIEHHLFPNISHIHYRPLSKLVKEVAIKHNLPYHVQDNFIKAVIAHIKMLKKLGQPVTSTIKNKAQTAII